MTPEQSWTPIKKALALCVDHPEVLTLDKAQMLVLEQRITEMASFEPVWSYISSHPMPAPSDDGTAGAPGPWATKVAICGASNLYQWRLSPGMRDAVRAALAEIVSSVKPPPASSPAALEVHAQADGSWTICNIAGRFGVTFQSVAYDATQLEYKIDVTNDFPRHLGAYVEFTDSTGAPVAPAAWTSRLPTGCSGLETSTRKYLGIVVPNTAIADMAMPTAATSLSFPLAQPAVGARVLFGGLGMGSIDPVVDAAAVLLTSFLDYALPVIMDGAAVGLTKSEWYRALVSDAAIVTEIMSQAQVILDDPQTDVIALLGAVETKIGTWLLGDRFPKLTEAIGKGLSATAIANAAPVLGWAETDLAIQAVDPPSAQTSSRVLSSPATFSLDLVPVTIKVLPDPRRGAWPDLATTLTVTTSYHGATLLEKSIHVPADGGAAIQFAIPAVPTGSTMAVTATAHAANGWVCGEAAALALTLTDGNPPTIELHLEEQAVPLTKNTTYTRRRTLDYDTESKTHVWQSGADSTPAATPLSVAVGITIQQATGTLGYTWRGSADDTKFAFQNIGVIKAEAALQYSGLIFSTQPHLLYDHTGSGSAASSGLGDNFYLDPRTESVDGLYHLRKLKLNGRGPFDLDQTTSWGAFCSSPSAIAVHPAGFVVACDYGGNTMQTLDLPASASALAAAPRAMFSVGPGNDPGQVQGPVGISVGPGGVILILEQGNSRVQALDPFGNPIPRFSGGSPFIELDHSAGVQFLDIALGPGGVVYVLSSMGHTPTSDDYLLDLYSVDGTHLSRTTGVVAMHIVVDTWGRLYSLGTAAIEGPACRLEPEICQWIPSAPEPGQ